jgi:acetylornithine/N-succinyldiaminopimelate aminotransferase
MKQHTKELHQLDKQTYLPVFKRFPVAFSHGNGSTLVDVDGKEYIDALSGIAVNSLGHNHPVITAAIQRQAGKLLHVSNFFVTEPQVRLAEALTQASGMDHVFFTNSGTESFEGGIKIARKAAGKRGRGTDVISMEHSFHGRTMAAIASGKASMQKCFGPMPEGFKQVPFNDIRALMSAVTPETGVIVLEPIQGEGGVHPADPVYLRQVRELCDVHGIVLIFDEIQCGMARTGSLFAKDYYGVKPDIMLLAKALGNGMPIGAILNRKEIGEAMDAGDHGTTFGGNPIACATALEVLDLIQRPAFMDEVKRKGALLLNELGKLRDRHDIIREVRGVGLMIGVELATEAKPIVLDMLERGVIANATAGNVLRLLPPLIISDADLRKVVSVLDHVLQEIEVAQ